MTFCIFPTLFECFAPGEGIELYLLLSALIREWYERSPHPAQDKLNVKIVYSLYSLKLIGVTSSIRDEDPTRDWDVNGLTL